jgi:thiamine biosynthesis lipoprotein
MILCLTGCTGSRAPRVESPVLERHQYVQVLMGVQVRLVLYTKSEEDARTAAKAAFDRVAELEDIMSDYRRDSELMRLCARAGSGPVPVSRELFEVLAYAQEVSKASDGAFDVTVGPYVQLWRLTRKTKVMPDAAALADARKRVGWKLVQLHPKSRTVELTVPGMRLDLGGIAKGYAGDEAIRVLREHGVRNALFEAGGDIVVSGRPPGTAGWEIETLDNRKLTLCDAAVSTSGDTEQFVELGGVRYSHVVDPHTGLGLTTQHMATVTAPRGITTDALSTAATVVGPGKSQRLAKQFGARAWVRIFGVETTSRQNSTTSETNP